MTSPTPPDAELIRRAQAGDEAAFTALAQAWHPRIFRWACGLLTDPDDADDVAQQALVRLYTHLGRFRGQARFSTWLYQITQNAARDAMRRRGRRTRALERMQVLAPPDTATRTATDALDTADVAERARTALGALPERQRTVLDLVDIQGYAPQEAADLLRLSPATVRVHLMRARRALRSAILAQLPELLEETP